MYTQQQASSIRQRFWVSFGKYMSPIPSSTGEKATWVNYRTGVKCIQFKMDADNGEAYIGIEIVHKDPSLQELYFNHFKTFKQPLEEDFLEEKWKWELTTTGVSRIYKKLENVSIYDENNWPQLISFLKPRIIALDKFWSEYKDIFEMLQ